MVYPMPLISELLQDMDKAMWYSSLDMVSGYWVVEMTETSEDIICLYHTIGSFKMFGNVF